MDIMGYSPKTNNKYKLPGEANGPFEPIRKSMSISDEHTVHVMTEMNCSKNSRKYQNRRFRPKVADSTPQNDVKRNTVAEKKGKMLRNKR